jgi:RNA polymerase sigma factor (TIGR02999 family)
VETAPDPEITQLLAALKRGGDAEAEAGVAGALPLVYAELRRVSAGLLSGERRNHTLQPTALVNEAYVRLAGRDTPWTDRRHFFRSAAIVMRHILVDHARERQAQKRGGDRIAIPLTDGLAVIGCDDDEILALDEALKELSDLDPRKAEVVEQRFFAGSTIAETAEVLGISAATVEREWSFARAWLRDRLSSEDP